MSNKSPIFPISKPSHFSDYGFDSQIDYFQHVLKEAMKDKQETERTIDSIHFKLQKPISKDNVKAKSKNQWWKSAFLLFKWRRSHCDNRREYVHGARTGGFGGSISGPLEIATSVQQQLQQQQRISTSAMPVYLVT